MTKESNDIDYLAINRARWDERAPHVRHVSHPDHSDHGDVVRCCVFDAALTLTLQRSTLHLQTTSSPALLRSHLCCLTQ